MTDTTDMFVAVDIPSTVPVRSQLKQSTLTISTITAPETQLFAQEGVAKNNHNGAAEEEVELGGPDRSRLHAAKDAESDLGRPQSPG